MRHARVQVGQDAGAQPAQRAPASAGARARRRARRAAAARSSPPQAARPRAGGEARRGEAARRVTAHLFAARHPAARARPRASRAPRRRARTPPRRASGRPARELGGERAVDGVAGAGGVDDVDLRRGQQLGVAAGSSSSAPRAPSVISTAAPVRSASARAAASGSSLARQLRGLGGVRREHETERGELVRQRARGAGLSTTGQPAAAARPARATTVLGDLVAEQHTPVAASQRRALDRDGVERGVGAGGDRDLVLAALRRRRSARRRSAPRAARPRRRRCPRRASATPPRRRSRRRRPRRRSPRAAPRRAAATAWLAPLPPPWRAKRPPVDGLARRGQALRDDHEVDVDRSDDDDAGLAHPRQPTPAGCCSAVVRRGFRPSSAGVLPAGQRELARLPRRERQRRRRERELVREVRRAGRWARRPPAGPAGSGARPQAASGCRTAAASGVPARASASSRASGSIR